MDSQRWPFAVFRPEIVQWSFNPIGSMVLLYMVLHGSHQYTPFIVSIYTSTMDPMGMIYPWFSCCSWFIDSRTPHGPCYILFCLVLFYDFCRNYPRNGDVPAIYPPKSCSPNESSMELPASHEPASSRCSWCHRARDWLHPKLSSYGKITMFNA